jgi:hypothetical protein
MHCHEDIWGSGGINVKCLSNLPFFLHPLFHGICDKLPTKVKKSNAKDKVIPGLN